VIVHKKYLLFGAFGGILKLSESSQD